MTDKLHGKNLVNTNLRKERKVWLSTRNQKVVAKTFGLQNENDRFSERK